MNVSRKIDYARDAIRSIGEHHDVDAAVRKAALVNLKAFCDEQASAIDAEVQAEIDAFGG